MLATHRLRVLAPVTPPSSGTQQQSQEQKRRISRSQQDAGQGSPHQSRTSGGHAGCSTSIHSSARSPRSKPSSMEAEETPGCTRNNLKQNPTMQTHQIPSSLLWLVFISMSLSLGVAAWPDGIGAGVALVIRLPDGRGCDWVLSCQLKVCKVVLGVAGYHRVTLPSLGGFFDLAPWSE